MDAIWRSGGKSTSDPLLVAETLPCCGSGPCAVHLLGEAHREFRIQLAAGVCLSKFFGIPRERERCKVLSWPVHIAGRTTQERGCFGLRLPRQLGDLTYQP